MGELVERVDEYDRVVGVVERSEATRQGWLHRIAVTVCRDPEGRILVMRRAAGIQMPGQATLMCGGAVDPGESYEVAAARELEEELGVSALVRHIFKYRCYTAVSPIWLGVHEAVVTGAVSPDSREIAWHQWTPEAEVRRLFNDGQFSAHVEDVFGRYLRS